MNSSSCPSIFVPKEISEKVQLLFQKKSGQTIRDAVELILKSDVGSSAGGEGGEMIDIGNSLQEGLSYLAQSPYETLDIPIGTKDENLIRKGYKKMALKYHPDKNPATTPLFQAIHSAYEKLSNELKGSVAVDNHKAQEPSQSSTTTPPSQSPKSKPPQEPHPSQSSTNEKKTRWQQQQQEQEKHQQQQKEKFAESQQRAKMKERMKQEAKRKEEEDAEQKRQEEEKNVTGREKEMREAEARAAERRGKTGYGNRPANQQRDHVQRKERSSTGQSYSAPSPRSSSHPTSTAPSSSSNDAPPPIPIPMGLKGEVVDVGTVQLEWIPLSQWDPPPSVITKYRIELSWREIMIQNPNGYGQIYQSDPQWEIGSLMITGDKVMKRNLNPGSVYEFSVRYRIPASIEKRQGTSVPPLPPAAAASASYGEWCSEITLSIPYGRSSKSQNTKRPSSSGPHHNCNAEETRKHVPTSTPSSQAGLSPRKPFSQSQPIPTGAPSSARTGPRAGGGEGGSGAATSKTPPSQSNEFFPQSNIPKYHSHAELFEDDGPELKQGTGTGMGTGLGSSEEDHLNRNSTSCSLYRKHYGSATSLPEEEEDDAAAGWGGGEEGDFVIPDVWVDDEMSDDEGDSPHKHETAKQTMKTKWYQLIPPDSHNGSGRYVHAVYLLKDLSSHTIGYISTANKILASKRLSDWMFVKTHWSTVKDANDLGAGGDHENLSSQQQQQQQQQQAQHKAPWGWVKRCEWNERLGRDHVFFRPIPKSVVSGLRYPTNRLSSGNRLGVEEETRGSGGEVGGGGGEGEIAGTEEEDMNDDQFQEKMSKSFRKMANVTVWYEQHDENGYPYFYNPKTGESRWEAPEWVEEIDPTSGAR
jgi:curved DNA-binding protein CbpA